MRKNYKPKEFAELLNVSVLTLQRWDNAGKLKAFRTPTNRRYYTYEQYQKYMGITTSNKKTVIYTRVSTSNQKDDLKKQVEFLKQYVNAKGIISTRRTGSRHNFNIACIFMQNIWFKKI